MRAMTNTTTSTNEAGYQGDHSSTALVPQGLAARRDLPSSAAEGAERATQIFRRLSVQDWIITAYFVVMLIAVILGSGPERAHAATRLVLDLAILWAGLVVVRGELLKRDSPASALIYRVSIFGTVVLSYFQLREILPAVTLRTLDLDIARFDLRVFGVEPALAWDHLVTPATTEWFAFFYFSFFFLMTAHSVGFLFMARDRDLVARFALGIFTVFCGAHLIYLIVPGYGPYHALAGSFRNELPRGPFWSMTVETVQAGGALKDIFPSLHAGAPTYFTIFAFMHRDRAPFKFVWPVLAFVTSQIIIATMFLRWHYLIDIFAGVAWASLIATMTFKVSAWEKARREQAGLPPAYAELRWSKLFPRGQRDSADERPEPMARPVA